MLYFLILLLVAVGLVVFWASKQPDVFNVERSILIAAPPEMIFPHINTLRAWKSWSPYEKLDPNMQQSYSGAESGATARMQWTGNSKAGSGSVTINASQPNSRIDIALDMLKPFEGHNNVVFSLVPLENGTTVTWAMSGKQPLIGKVFGLIMNMDKMVGGQFAEGLANLKRVVEDT